MAVNRRVNFELIRLGKVTWDVLATTDVVDSLSGEGIDRSYWPVLEWMFGLLRRRVPAAGPSGGDLVKSLGDDILEFRKQPRRGPKLRVLWFYDAHRTIICTNVELKRSEVEGKNLAMTTRQKYLAAKAAGRIRIRNIEEIEEI